MNKEYAIDTRGRLSKEVTGGYIVHPIAFEEQQMLSDTEYLVNKRHENQVRVKTNTFQTPRNVWKDRTLPYKTRRGVEVSIAQRGNK